MSGRLQSVLGCRCECMVWVHGVSAWCGCMKAHMQGCLPRKQGVDGTCNGRSVGKHANMPLQVHVQLTRVPVHLTRVLLTRAQLAEVWLQQNGVMLPFIDAQKRWEWGPIQEHYKSKTALAADYYTKQMRGIAFIEYTSSRDAEEALPNLHRMYIGGKEVTATYAKEVRGWKS
eukprot:1155849-Pelagomonas_calceolata.AAC.4